MVSLDLNALESVIQKTQGTKGKRDTSKTVHKSKPYRKFSSTWSLPNTTLNKIKYRHGKKWTNLEIRITTLWNNFCWKVHYLTSATFLYPSFSAAKRTRTDEQVVIAVLGKPIFVCIQVARRWSWNDLLYSLTPYLMFPDQQNPNSSRVAHEGELIRWSPQSKFKVNATEPPHISKYSFQDQTIQNKNHIHPPLQRGQQIDHHRAPTSKWTPPPPQTLANLN
jgi:hypothetical protein